MMASYQLSPHIEPLLILTDRVMIIDSEPTRNVAGQLVDFPGEVSIAHRQSMLCSSAAPEVLDIEPPSEHRQAQPDLRLLREPARSQSRQGVGELRWRQDVTDQTARVRRQIRVFVNDCWSTENQERRLDLAPLRRRPPTRLDDSAIQSELAIEGKSDR